MDHFPFTQFKLTEVGWTSGVKVRKWQVPGKVSPTLCKETSLPLTVGETIVSLPNDDHLHKTQFKLTEVKLPFFSTVKERLLQRIYHYNSIRKTLENNPFRGAMYIYHPSPIRVSISVVVTQQVILPQLLVPCNLEWLVDRREQVLAQVGHQIDEVGEVLLDLLGGGAAASSGRGHSQVAAPSKEAWGMAC